MSLSDAQLELLTTLAGTETLDAICARSILPAHRGLPRRSGRSACIGLVRRLDVPAAEVRRSPRTRASGAVLG